MLYLAGNALWLLFLLTLFFLSGSGVLLLRRSDTALADEEPTEPSRDPEVERIVDVLLRIALGAAAWMGILFLLAAVGLLRSGPVFAGIVLATLGGLSGLRRHPLPTGSGAPKPPALTDRLPTALLSLVLLTVGAGLWLHTQRPDLAWDADVYHLSIPRLYLQEGGFVRLPFNVYSNWPLNTQLLYALGLLLDGRVLAKQLHFVFGMLGAATAFALVLRHPPTKGEAPAGGRLAGTIAAVLFLANPVVLYEIRIAYVDLVYAFYFALAFLFLQRSLERPASSRQGDLGGQGLLLVAGVLAGVAAGTKLNGFFAPLALAGVWAGSRLFQGRAQGPVPWIREGLCLLGPSLLLLPWLVKSWLLTGNPVYPLFWNTLGGPEWSSELASQHAAWQSSIGMGRTPLDYLLLPWRVITQGDFGYAHFDGQVSRSWSVLIPLTLLFGWRDRLVRRALGASAIFFVLWSLTSQQIRFLIPVLPLLAAAVGRTLHRVLAQLSSREPRPAQLASWLAAGAAGALLAQPAWLYLRQDPRLLADLVRHGAALEEAVPRPVYRVIDEELPADARLLMVNTNRAFFVERNHIADSFFEASQLVWALRGDRVQVEQTLRDLGITHVLIENVNRGIEWSPSFLAMLEDPEVSPVVFRSADGRFGLHKLEL